MLGLLLLALAACDQGVGEGPCDALGPVAGPSVVDLEVHGRPVCLGTLVSERWALTAKHCVQLPGVDLPESEVVAVDADGVAISVSDIEVLGGSYETLGELVGRDLALLELASPSLAPNLAPGQDVAADLTEGCVVLAGDPFAPTSVRVRAVESQVVYTDGVACPGDSGGPLLALDGRLLGVASWRTEGECGTGLSAFTRVDVEAHWVDRITRR